MWEVHSVVCDRIRPQMGELPVSQLVMFHKEVNRLTYISKKYHWITNFLALGEAHLIYQQLIVGRNSVKNRGNTRKFLTLQAVQTSGYRDSGHAMVERELALFFITCSHVLLKPFSSHSRAKYLLHRLRWSQKSSESHRLLFL